MKRENGGRRAALLAGMVLSLMSGSLPAAEAKRVVENSVASEIQLTPLPEQDDGQKSLTAPPAAGSDKIPCMVWQDKVGEPKAAMLCIHGFGLHKGTYDAFANEMAKAGIATYAIDVRGFGMWVRKGKNKIDFPGTMKDIGLALNEIHRLHPNLKIIVLGESMGGAIAMKTAEMYPDLVEGLISSVPAGDRYDKADSQIGVVKHVFLHGFNAPLDVGPAIVGAATKKESLRQTWLNDPLTRTQVTPNELIQFRDFMNSTFDMAPRIKTARVLFIQGSNDKLVRPAGTYKLFGSLATPFREIVLSKTAEHLIFEDGQFNDQDLGFVKNWISNNIVALGTGTGSTVLAKKTDATNATANQVVRFKADDKVQNIADTLNDATGNTNTESNTESGTTGATTSTQIASVPPTGKKPSIAQQALQKTALSYWIELKRNGKIYRCNNKTAFTAGDAIRFHVIPESDGYAYVVLEQGSAGEKAVLFPSKEAGQHNYLRREQDYPLPYSSWIAFDNHPGLEKVRIMFSKTEISMDKLIPSTTKIAYVSHETEGAKDLIGTRMQLSWDDPNPVIMPDEIASAALASHTASSQVRLVYDNPDGTLAVDVALMHR